VDLGSDAAYKELFSESPSRVVASCDPSATDKLVDMAETLGVPVRVIGSVGGSDISFGSALSLDLAEVTEVFESSLAAKIAGGE
jgi:hypothetical protein